MMEVRKQVVALYVDRASGQWVVMDGDGSLWSVAFGDDPWEDRQPFFPDEATELEPVPGHYKYMLGLPT